MGSKKMYEARITYSEYNTKYDNTSFYDKALYFRTYDINKITASIILQNSGASPSVKLTVGNIISFKEITDLAQIHFISCIKRESIIEI